MIFLDAMLINFTNLGIQQEIIFGSLLNKVINNRNTISPDTWSNELPFAFIQNEILIAMIKRQSLSAYFRGISISAIFRHEKIFGGVKC